MVIFFQAFLLVVSGTKSYGIPFVYFAQNVAGVGNVLL